MQKIEMAGFIIAPVVGLSGVLVIAAAILLQATGALALHTVSLNPEKSGRMTESHFQRQ
ncbi:hypothetical protein [Desulfomonile tiedjei]|uniref:Uncharacterized protein n=1 Tax=Desulfomonile tiedjei (strain ATCC 49306 / DSM 6799 / DCB-1) TaxID=706587 RepID=I4CBV8_DESTA|nr:hypothetical protein [Desulfomonile tiedjei]AFM27049.1 hypothetical protein Desti_4417 [Desulfomonile tiedjei DSM 6799]